MDERRKFMETGEMGFCPVCGTISDVVVLPDDRLQKRIAKLMERQLLVLYPEFESNPIDVVRLGTEWIETITEHSGEFNYKEILVGIQMILTLAAEALGEVTGEEIDLMRLAMEFLEEEHA